MHINNWSRMKPGLRLLARTRFSKLRDVIMSQKSLNLDAARHVFRALGKRVLARTCKAA